MYEPVAICTTLLILGTCVASYLGFQSRELEEKYIFCPERILVGKEYYRLVTSAFLHGGWGHLVWNMVGLYSFGRGLEWSLGKSGFLLVYFGAVVGGNLLSLYVHRHHIYAAVGASGGVCGVVFAALLLFPGVGVALYFVLPIPGWLFAIGFIVVSFLAMKNARDNTGHDVHLGGAIVGLLIAAALRPEAVHDNWKVFLLVLIPAVLVLFYLWFNPLFLPVASFLGHRFRAKRRPARRSGYEPTPAQVDAILEKVTKAGVHSLTPAERSLLEQASGKYRRRAESRKPKSGLPI